MEIRIKRVNPPTNKIIKLPAVPRVGEFVVVDKKDELKVEKVVYSYDSSIPKEEVLLHLQSGIR